MIKRILVPLDGSDYTEAALTLAIQLAQQNDAEITGVVVLDTEGIEKSIGPVPIGAIRLAERLGELKAKEATARIEENLARFHRLCDRGNVRHREARFQGRPSESIVGESLYYDLVVAGTRTFFRFSGSPADGDLLVDVLDSTVTPLLAAPKELSGFDLRNGQAKALIAFGGSLPAARALHRFAQLVAPQSVDVTLLMSHADEAFARYHLQRAEDYLRAQGIAHLKARWTSEPIIKTVEQKYLASSDIFVVGANSKGRAKKFVLGSLPQYLLTNSHKPVFIGQ